MKRNFKQFCAATLLALSNYTYGQGTFQNLDFESPIPPLTTDPLHHLLLISNALPGWTAYYNGNPSDWVFFGDIALGSPSISVVDDSLTPYGFPPIQGLYSVFLNEAVLGQTGLIPNDAASLFFRRGPNAFVGVSFAGQGIPLVPLGTSGNSIIMACDISMFAGQTGELRFLGMGLFDNIQFSNQSIPEPSTYCLFGLGALLLGWRWRKRMETAMRSGLRA